MATFNVYQQPDETWAWRVLEGGRQHVMGVSPGYTTAGEAAVAAATFLDGPYKALAARLAASIEAQTKR